MTIPAGLKYSEEHEWIKIEGDVALVGISDFAQNELGDIVYVDYTVEEGDEVAKDGIFGSIEAVKTTSDLFLPVSGEVVEVNDGINDEPEKVNEDPYGAGWLIKIKVKDMGQLDSLMDDKAYKEMVGGE